LPGLVTSSIRILDPREIEAADKQASVFMEEGIGLLQSANNVDAALRCFDRALELRRRLPTEVPVHAYGLAACWLNRAEALSLLGPGYHALALGAYDEALALLRPLPLGDDTRYSRRLAIAHQNRALVLAAQNPPATADAIAALIDAIAVLDNAEAMDVSEREYLLAVVWMNLANIHASEAAIVPDRAAQAAARRALAFVKPQEHEHAAAAEVGLKGRHVLCQVVARRLPVNAGSETVMTDVYDATDLADEGLDLVREWERRGIDRFRKLASDLLRFGARVYAYYQPHFLHEFLSEQLDPENSTHAYVQSVEMREVAREIALGREVRTCAVEETEIDDGSALP
jgi:tetratricopeptide (TPR) repeat protein